MTPLVITLTHFDTNFHTGGSESNTHFQIGGFILKVNIALHVGGFFLLIRDDLLFRFNFPSTVLFFKSIEVVALQAP